MVTNNSENQGLFVLDIGTRSIVGLIMEKSKPVRILAVEYLEHETRSMYDGQIHDVIAVAEEIATVKRRLEEKTGMRLTRAAVAAAGRALKTARGKAWAVRNPGEEVVLEEVQALELEAVQQAQLKIAGEEPQVSSGYFCVGYSVMNFYLEDQVIKNLIGQTGNSIGLEVIATFLPRVVVDSLFSALRRAGLEVCSLTLEPIAALTAAVPPDMRLINLALVDIGAGTSDIALVDRGTVFGYGMVPMGGDEITEAIAEHYLLDFNTAEKVKCRLNLEKHLSFTDILENQVTVDAEEILGQIHPVIRELANSIAVEIMSINQKSPDAVLCVGGGSMTPMLLGELAAALEIPARRVGVRTRETLKEIQGDFPELTGPQAITPIGIGLIALRSQALPLIRVTVNGREVSLWGLNEVTVASALLASGINLNNIYGRPGLGVTLEVNGQVRVFRGQMGSLPVIKVNGEAAGLDMPLKEGDVVEFQPGKDGEDARVLVRDLLQDQYGVIRVNGQPVQVMPLVLVNGQEMDWEEVIPDRSRVDIVKGNRVQTVLKQAGYDVEQFANRTYRFTVNDAPTQLLWCPLQVAAGSKKLNWEDIVLFNEDITCKMYKNAPTVRQVLNISEEHDVITVRVNEQPVNLPRYSVKLTVNGAPATWEDPLEDGDSIQYSIQERTSILSDVLPYVDIPYRKTGHLVIRVNGEEAGFATPINDHDAIEVYWEDLPFN